MKDICLVVPTIRQDCLYKFLSKWASVGLFEKVDLLVVEDHLTKTFELGGLTLEKGSMPTYCHVSWKEIDERLGGISWIIPRCSDTIRSFGYFKAYDDGYKYIMTLDDDCYPCTEIDGITYDGAGFVGEHLRNIDGKTRWFNTLNSVKPRGIPFKDLGMNENIVLNHGLWTNVLDYDAPTQLVAPKAEEHSFDNYVIPSGVYFPMCGMNLMWKAEITPLMYHLLMGQRILVNPFDEHDRPLKKLPFDRFGDIWCGIILKKILDHMHKSVSSGMPYIHHDRASNPFTNLKKEANGLEVNEKFWRFIDSIMLNGLDSYEDCYAAIAYEIKSFNAFPEYIGYFEDLGDAMNMWLKLFDARRI